MWLGWYVDCDVWHPENTNSWLGDLSGYRTSSLMLDGEEFDIAAAWTADNSGDPDESGNYNERSCLGVFGSMFLESQPALPEVSFNWWNIGFTESYDWGPTRTPSDTNINGYTGRAIGDAMRYRRMANREIDYDQVYAAIDHTGDGWNPPTTDGVARDFANGYDARFLHTRGMIDLAPGDSVVTVWTWVVAPGLHSDPSHYSTTFDADDPSVYLGGLNFRPLDTALARMKQLWNTRFADALVGAPKLFRIAGWDDDAASLAWLPRMTRRVTGYAIYQSFDPDNFSGPAVASLPHAQSAFTDGGLSRVPVHYYTIRSIDDKGRLGLPSPVIDVLPDRPHQPAILGTQRGNSKIRVMWDAPSEPDVESHRVYRRASDADWEFVGETFQPGSMLDGTADNATPYEYRITSMSELRSESYPSETVTGVAFAFDGRPLVIDHTLSGGTAQTNKDSVAAVWQRMASPLAADYRDADPYTTAPFALDVYDPRPVTIVVTDGRQGPQPNWAEQMEYYLHAGGVALLSGRDLFNADIIAEGTLTFGPGDLAYDYFGIESAYYPRVLLSHPTRPNAEFIAARSLDPELPDLAVDASRTDWGLNPVLPKPGDAVPFVGFFDVDESRAEVIYEYVSRDSSTSFSHGRVAGIVSTVPGVHAAVLSFPLSYADEAAATAMVRTLMRRMGWVGERPGDLDGDGFVTVLDLSRVIDYAFAGGSLTNVNNADVNGDCKVNLIDVVILIDYVFFGGTELVPGCAGY
jgi:hypothetical protein